MLVKRKARTSSAPVQRISPPALPELQVPGEHVLILGKCCLYSQKAPFVRSGQSVRGALEYNEAEDAVRCHECGNWFRNLATHVTKAHCLPPSKYRDRHGLRRKCALCGPRLAAAFAEGKKEYYERLGAMVRTPEARAAFGKMARETAGSRRCSTDLAERQNDQGHCRAQLDMRLRQLQKHYGRSPTIAEMKKHGLSPASVCLAFNVSTVPEVFRFLRLPYNPGGHKYTRKTLIEILRDFWAKYRCLPGRAHVRMGLVPREGAFLRVFGSMPLAYDAAGLAQAPRSPYTRKMLIDQIRAFHRRHGEPPRASRKYGRGHGDSLPAPFPSRKVFVRIFGSLGAAYQAAGVAA